VLLFSSKDIGKKFYQFFDKNKNYKKTKKIIIATSTVKNQVLSIQGTQ